MCGIAGAIGSIDPEVVSAVERMNDAQTHRGPDQSGIFSSTSRGPGIVFGHRRLSILDLSEAGRQPMVEPESGVTIVFNGEVYNFAELRSELEALGAVLRSHSDTEVIALAYARWGESVITRLRGMFAIALWDPRDETVLFVRDRLGIKPLYVTQQNGVLLFASEVRALLASGRVERRLDPQSMASFLWHGFVPGSRTIIEGIRLLPPATTMRVGLDGRLREPKRYWQLPRHDPDDEERAVRRVGETLSEAVRLRLIADVPLGIFLSGGIDSSAIAALAQRASRSPIQTFNIRFEEAGYDESPHARAVAQALGTDHREVTLSEEQFAAHLDEALLSIDQPTFDAINTYFVSRAVKEAGLTVALAGTGGDELFGGYSSFVDLPRARAVNARLRNVPDAVLSRVARIGKELSSRHASELRQQTRWGKLGDVLAARDDLVALYQVGYALFSRELWASFDRTSHTSLEWGLSPERARELRELVGGEPELSAISMLELSSFLGERLLRDTDAASMAVSLEVRVPLIDHLVVEALARVPLERRYARGKALLKQLVARDLDERLFDRKKAGFELPLQRWCRQRLSSTLRDTMSDLAHSQRIGLDAEVVARLWRSFEKGGAGMYWSRIWALFVLSFWCRQHGVYV